MRKRILRTPAEVLQRKKEYYEKNKERIRAYQREYYKTFYPAHKDAINTQKRNRRMFKSKCKHCRVHCEERDCTCACLVHCLRYNKCRHCPEHCPAGKLNFDLVEDEKRPTSVQI